MFSKDSMDLIYCKVQPFKIIFEPGTKPIASRSYRYKPEINIQLDTSLDQLLGCWDELF